MIIDRCTIFLCFYIYEIVLDLYRDLTPSNQPGVQSSDGPTILSLCAKEIQCHVDDLSLMERA